MRTPDLRSRAGVTLVELLVAVAIMGLVLSAALSFARQQQQAFSLGTGRMDVLQRHRFAADQLEENLRSVGTGVPDGQPFLVYADTNTVAFNVDFATNDSNDSFALYFDPSAPATQVGSLTRAHRITLPGTSFAYPDSTYRNGGGTSPAETIIFFFAPDTSTSRGDDYVLFRQVNDLAPAVVTRGLLHTAGAPFFAYQELQESDTAATSAAWIPGSALPLAHRVPIHHAAADTASAARIDRIRAVRVSFTATSGRRSGVEQTRSIQRVIRMPNAGREPLHTCGDPPSTGFSVSAAQVTGSLAIELAWNSSVDDGSGEDDVVRYAIYRREDAATDWGPPYFSIPAGQSTYSFTDEQVAADSSYQYAVAAQDCTPALSGLQTSALVHVNP
jgi:prepilin-type N-terminal cleavage/methylation domain-containing protein